MTQRWEIDIPEQPGAVPRLRAVAYYRHSAQDRQENSIPIQQEQVREWAQKNGVEIIQEFADVGKSGLTAEDRPAFTEPMQQWVKRIRPVNSILLRTVTWGVELWMPSGVSHGTRLEVGAGVAGADAAV